MSDPGDNRCARLLFNARHYAKQAYCAEERAFEDFRASGFRRLLDPHPLFDVRYFVSSQPLTDASADPFEALAASGGHCPVTTPFFNLEWYRASNPDVVRAGVDPFLHYIEHGAREGRQANPWYKLRPFSDDPEVFFGALGSLDDWIENADTARIVTAEWIRGFAEISPSGSHAAFWRARAAGARACPINLESLFGPVEQAAREEMTLMSRTLRRLTLAGTPA